MLRLAGWLVASFVAAGVGSADASQGLVSRTAVKVPAAVVAVEVAPPVLSMEAVDVGFMPGISLNVARDAVVAQEGEAPLPRRTARSRATVTGLGLHADIATLNQWYLANDPAVDVHQAAYRARDVFGYEAAHFDYSANPHTGLYDTLHVELVVPAGKKVDGYADFQAVRALLVDALGAPAVEGVSLSDGLVDNVVSRRTINRLTAAGRGAATATWQADGYTVQLAGTPPGARKARTAVARLTVTADFVMGQGWLSPERALVTLPR